MTARLVVAVSTLVLSLPSLSPLYSADYLWTGAVSSDWADAANWNPNTTAPGPGDHATINFGSPSILTTAIVADLDLNGGTLGGSGSLTVTNLFTWTGGTMAGMGSTTIASDAQLLISGDTTKTLDSRTLTNLGTITWSGSGNILVKNAAPLFNEGLFDIQSDATYQKDTWSAAGSFSNTGTLHKSAGTGTSTFDQIPVSCTGKLVADQGTLQINSSLTLAPTTIIDIGISGPNSPNNYGQIISPNPITLKGTLQVSYLNDYSPEPQTFYSAISAPLQGTFLNFLAPAVSDGLFLNPVYLPDRVQLELISPTPVLKTKGDFNNDGLFSFDIQGAVNQQYGVDASTNLVDWVRIQTGTIPASTVWTFADTDQLTFPQRFYRVSYNP